MTAPTLDAASFEVIGHLTDDAISALADLLIAFDELESHPAPAAPERNGGTTTGNQE